MKDKHDDVPVNPSRREFLRQAAHRLSHIGLVAAGLSAHAAREARAAQESDPAQKGDPDLPPLDPNPDGACNFQPPGHAFPQSDSDCGSETQQAGGWGPDEDCGVTSGTNGAYYEDQDCGIQDNIGVSLSGWRDNDCGKPVGTGATAGVSEDSDCGIANNLGGSQKDHVCGQPKPGQYAFVYTDEDCGHWKGVARAGTENKWSDDDPKQDPVSDPAPLDPNPGS